MPRTTTSCLPPPSRLVVGAFRNAPYKTPTGAQRISLYVDAGPNSVMNFDTGARWDSLSSSRQITAVTNFDTQTAGTRCEIVSAE